MLKSVAVNTDWLNLLYIFLTEDHQDLIDWSRESEGVDWGVDDSNPLLKQTEERLRDWRVRILQECFLGSLSHTAFLELRRELGVIYSTILLGASESSEELLEDAVHLSETGVSAISAAIERVNPGDELNVATTTAKILDYLIKRQLFSSGKISIGLYNVVSEILFGWVRKPDEVLSFFNQSRQLYPFQETLPNSNQKNKQLTTSDVFGMSVDPVRKLESLLQKRRELDKEIDQAFAEVKQMKLN